MQKFTALMASCFFALGLAIAQAPLASALPRGWSEPRLATQFDCSSVNPHGGRLFITVQGFTNVMYPKDGTKGDVLYLVANNFKRDSLQHFDVDVKVKWRNLTTGKSGTTRIPGYGTRIAWEGSLPTGAGKVVFSIKQKIGIRLLTPMRNARFSYCKSSATVTPVTVPKVQY